MPKKRLLPLLVLGALAPAQTALADKAACFECHAETDYGDSVTKHRVVPCHGCHEGYLDICTEGKPPLPEAGSLAAMLSIKTGRSPQAAASCKSCHEKEFNEWSDSDHGMGMLAQGNADAAYCFDCHGPAHQLGRKLGAEKRHDLEEMVAVCTRCHEDPKLAERNKLNINVVGTYRDSLHGKALYLGDDHSAACHHCHNSHDVRGSNDPKSAVSADNIVATCERCHEGSTPAFAAAFGHHVYTPDDMVLGFWISQFFAWMTMSVMGLLVIHAALDAYHLLRHKKADEKEHAEGTAR